MNPYESMMKGVRNAFITGKTKELNFRREQLRNLLRMYEENGGALVAALQEDMQKPDAEAISQEINLVKRDITYALNNLSKWSQPTRKPVNALAPFDKIYVRHEPYGVVLIIGPWNYLHLTIMPLTGAIAAGNCAVIKPSELTSHCADKVAELLPKYLDESCYKVVLGGPEDTHSLLLEKFDYIFYTGNFNVGRIIHAAANKNLTPVTLGLGGKCPVYIDLTANLRMTAQRIMWGKCNNLGQSCTAPDYILSTKMIQSDLINQIKLVLKECYGDDLQKSKDFARIINARHFSRLKTMLSKTRGKVVIGGKTDEYDLWIEPTVIGNVQPTDALMQEEILGPMLPMLTVDSIHEAVDFIRDRPKPPCIYLFTKRKAVVDFFLKNTDSGGFTVNDCNYNGSIFHLPFGGVGESGFGQYHGKWSFSTFSRPRAVAQRNFKNFQNKTAIEPRYPPYSARKSRFIKMISSYFESLYIDPIGYAPYIICFLAGVVTALVLISLELFSTEFSSHPEPPHIVNVPSDTYAPENATV